MTITLTNWKDIQDYPIDDPIAMGPNAMPILYASDGSEVSEETYRQACSILSQHPSFDSCTIQHLKNNVKNCDVILIPPTWYALLHLKFAMEKYMSIHETYNACEAYNICKERECVETQSYVKDDVNHQAVARSDEKHTEEMESELSQICKNPSCAPHFVKKCISEIKIILVELTHILNPQQDTTQKPTEQELKKQQETLLDLLQNLQKKCNFIYDILIRLFPQQDMQSIPSVDALQAYLAADALKNQEIINEIIRKKDIEKRKSLILQAQKQESRDIVHKVSVLWRGMYSLIQGTLNFKTNRHIVPSSLLQNINDKVQEIFDLTSYKFDKFCCTLGDNFWEHLLIQETRNDPDINTIKVEFHNYVYRYLHINGIRNNNWDRRAMCKVINTLVDLLTNIQIDEQHCISRKCNPPYKKLLISKVMHMLHDSSMMEVVKKVIGLECSSPYHRQFYLHSSFSYTISPLGLLLFSQNDEICVLTIALSNHQWVQKSWCSPMQLHNIEHSQKLLYPYIKQILRKIQWKKRA